MFVITHYNDLFDGRRYVGQYAAYTPIADRSGVRELGDWYRSVWMVPGTVGVDD